MRAHTIAEAVRAREYVLYEQVVWARRVIDREGTRLMGWALFWLALAIGLSIWILWPR